MKKLNNKQKKLTTITLEVELADRIRIATIQSPYGTIGEYVKSVMDKVQESEEVQK